MKYLHFNLPRHLVFFHSSDTLCYVRLQLNMNIIQLNMNIIQLKRNILQLNMNILQLNVNILQLNMNINFLLRVYTWKYCWKCSFPIINCVCLSTCAFNYVFYTCIERSSSFLFLTLHAYTILNYVYFFQNG